MRLRKRRVLRDALEYAAAVRKALADKQEECQRLTLERDRAVAEAERLRWRLQRNDRR